MENALATRHADDGEILFSEGIIGVPRARRFQLMERPDSPIRVLTCLDIENFALPVIDPGLADPAYRPALGPRMVEALGLRKDDPVLILAVASLEESGPVANLRAPLVINVGRRIGLQLILDDASYPLRAPVRTGG